MNEKNMIELMEAKITRLSAENDRLIEEKSALRERLEKAIELPVKIGDRVFYIVGLSPTIEECEVEEIVIERTNPTFAVFRFRRIDTGIKATGFLSDYGKRWFTSREAADAHLKTCK